MEFSLRLVQSRDTSSDWALEWQGQEVATVRLPSVLASFQECTDQFGAELAQLSSDELFSGLVSQWQMLHALGGQFLYDPLRGRERDLAMWRTWMSCLVARRRPTSGAWMKTPLLMCLTGVMKCAMPVAGLVLDYARQGCRFCGDATDTRFEVADTTRSLDQGLGVLPLHHSDHGGGGREWRNNTCVLCRACPLMTIPGIIQTHNIDREGMTGSVTWTRVEVPETKRPANLDEDGEEMPEMLDLLLHLHLPRSRARRRSLPSLEDDLVQVDEKEESDRYYVQMEGGGRYHVEQTYVEPSMAWAVVNDFLADYKVGTVEWFSCVTFWFTKASPDDYPLDVVLGDVFRVPEKPNGRIIFQLPLYLAKVTNVTMPPQTSLSKDLNNHFPSYMKENGHVKDWKDWEKRFLSTGRMKRVVVQAFNF